jgi:hypothetical protein
MESLREELGSGGSVATFGMVSTSAMPYLGLVLPEMSKRTRSQPCIVRLGS